MCSPRFPQPGDTVLQTILAEYDRFHVLHPAYVLLVFVHMSIVFFDAPCHAGSRNDTVLRTIVSSV